MNSLVRVSRTRSSEANRLLLCSFPLVPSACCAKREHPLLQVQLNTPCKVPSGSGLQPSDAGPGTPAGTWRTRKPGLLTIKERVSLRASQMDVFWPNCTKHHMMLL